ncbi:MAG: GUN4 domain-containing protein [Cyanobacteria bacterium P01_H01_bin.15]
MSQPPNQDARITVENFWQILDTKIISVGLPGVLVGIGINHVRENEWTEAIKFFALASLLWFFLRVSSEVFAVLKRFFEEWLSRAEQKFYDQANFPEKEYFDALKTYCYDLEIEGFKGELPAIALDDIFVPIKFYANSNQKLKSRIRKEIWDILPKESHRSKFFNFPRIIVLADPGYGKTTLTRYLALSYTSLTYREKKAKKLVPLLLPLRDIHVRIESEKNPSLPEMSVFQIQNLPVPKSLNISESVLDDLLRSGKCLVMFDGLDEVPENKRKIVSKWINWQMLTYPSQFIVTTRPHGYDGSLFRGVQKVGIYSFNKRQKKEFIKNWYRLIFERDKWEILYRENKRKSVDKHISKEQVDALSQAQSEAAANDLMSQIIRNPALNQLAENPLLITIIAVTHRKFESLPSLRVHLYRKMFDHLLEHRPVKRKTDLAIRSSQDAQHILQAIAFQLTRHKSTGFSIQQGREWIESRLKDYSNSLEPENFLYEIKTVAGLLVSSGHSHYQFTHKTFQEYLAAAELKDIEKGGKLLVHYLHDADLEEVICFYAAMTSANPFVESVLKNPNNHNLRLAFRLIKEGSKIDNKLRIQLIRKILEFDLKDAALPEARLEYRFRTLVEIEDGRAEITRTPITLGEYQLLIESQASTQFHSNAKPLQMGTNQVNLPAYNMSRKDAYWFCAWLSTQVSLQNQGEGKYVYDFLLPTQQNIKDYKPSRRMLSVESSASSLHKELLEKSIPWTENPKETGNSIRIVRRKLDRRYRSLITHLANAEWNEADQETENLILELLGRSSTKDNVWLSAEDIQSPKVDCFQIINHLWLKFSGGHFGFGVQKKVYTECGAKLNRKYPGDQAWHEFLTRVGWNKSIGKPEDDDFILYDRMPKGHLPMSANYSIIVRDAGGFLGDTKMNWSLPIFLFVREDLNFRI